jgi:hypothetical protein
MQIKFDFEELPSFWRGDMRSGAHNGSAEITALHDGEWAITAISLDCHNGKCGNAAKGEKIEISRSYDGALFHALCQSLERFHTDNIQDAVNDALASRRDEAFPSRLSLQRAS